MDMDADIESKLVYARQCRASGKLLEAEVICRSILARAPNHAGALYQLGLVACEAGHFDQALPLLDQAVRAAPRNAEMLNTLGEARRCHGDFVGSIKTFRQALKIKPDFSEAMSNLARVLGQQGKLAEALTYIERALRLAASDPGAWVEKGRILQLQGRQGEAVSCYERALSLDQNVWEAHVNLGAALRYLREPQRALAHFQRALEINPASAEAFCNRGTAFEDLGQLGKAIESFQQALQLKPDYADALFNLANVLRLSGDHDAAVRYFHEALRINPQDVLALHNMGTTLLELGDIAGAKKSWEQAVALRPDFADAWRGLLASLLYLPEVGAQASFARHREFAAVFTSLKGKAAASRFEQRDGSGKIRVGYVSSDFCTHPVARNILPLLACHDREHFEIYLYGNVKKPDAQTQALQSNADAWRSILGMSDSEAAELIRRDQVDILVLLAGHFDDNRPLIANYRAAPVQVSLHDPVTSGLDNMDYLICDANLSPRTSPEKFTERRVRLPTFFLHAPMTGAPEVSVLPASHAGHVTFGSFNNPAKVNERVVALWARVLKVLPEARLVLKYRAVFGGERVSRRYRALFAEHGIEPARVDLVGETEALDRHLARYAGIDIALDPFPFSGSTTTFEALWMGVPVITLAGEMMVGRWSMAMLKKIGLDEFIATNEDAYVEIAKRMAENLPYLAEVRKDLRERVTHSSLCDDWARTRQLERVYRWMWCKGCAEQEVKLSEMRS